MFGCFGKKTTWLQFKGCLEGGTNTWQRIQSIHWSEPAKGHMKQRHLKKKKKKKGLGCGKGSVEFVDNCVYNLRLPLPSFRPAPVLSQCFSRLQLGTKAAVSTPAVMSSPPTHRG